jgi:hypothetical protein
MRICSLCLNDDSNDELKPAEHFLYRNECECIYFVHEECQATWENHLRKSRTTTRCLGCNGHAALRSDIRPALHPVAVSRMESRIFATASILWGTCLFVIVYIMQDWVSSLYESCHVDL